MKPVCCSAADAADAQRVADLLDIPFHAIDFQREFDRIVDYFVGEYAAGRTPNPCIVCNTWLKFGKLFEYADAIGAEYVATGHHARLVTLEKGDSPHLCEAPFGPFRRAPTEGWSGTVPFFLCRGRDESKDQSYALFGIRRELLPRLLFPVGEHRKEEIRRIAGRLGLRVAEKRDSQEICFIPDRDHARFVRQRRGGIDTSGEIVATDGTLLGRHEGIEQFTVGQRKGLRLAFGEPRYVVRIEPSTRRVVLGTHEELARRELTAAEANWLVGAGERMKDEGRRMKLAAIAKPQAANPQIPQSPNPKSSAFRAQVQIRYRSRPAEASVELLPGDRFRVRFDEPCYAIAPGQAAVCYDGERVLGGGWIE